jgi:hypothetical protein
MSDDEKITADDRLNELECVIVALQQRLDLAVEAIEALVSHATGKELATSAQSGQITELTAKARFEIAELEQLFRQEPPGRGAKKT